MAAIFEAKCVLEAFGDVVSVAKMLESGAVGVSPFVKVIQFKASRSAAMIAFLRCQRRA